MKTIVRNDNRVSLYLFPAETPISAYESHIDVGMPVFLIVADCNSNNVTVHGGVTPPNDWTAWKYTFDGSDWAKNPDWVEPELQ